jgi:signal peptidase
MGTLTERIATALLFLLILVALSIVVAPRFGWRLDTVYSGSMEPAIMTGDLVVTRPVATGDISVGDIITFATSKGLTCHRVASAESDPTRFVTRGDSNDCPDPMEVTPENVRGKVVTHIPMAGYFSQFVKTPFGLIVTIVLPGLLIIGAELKSMFGRGEKDQ